MRKCDINPFDRCVWYWIGGRERGQWREASPGTRASIRQGGRVAHDGSLAIGPPEGPPSEADFAAVLPSGGAK